MGEPARQSCPGAFEGERAMKRAALFVGVNRYEDPEINPLQFAEKDAAELYGFFRHRGEYDEAKLLLSPESDEILDTARGLVEGLEPGDVFLFFFAGHGYVWEGRHLLLCPQARYRRLRYLQQTVPVDLLKEETEREGVHRVVVLDACRTNLLAGDRGAPAGLRDVGAMRRLAEGVTGGGFALVCACDEGQQSRELPNLEHGVFTAAMLRVLEETVRQERAVVIGDEFVSKVEREIVELLKGFGSEARQRPWYVRSGSVAPLFGVLAEAEGTPMEVERRRPQRRRTEGRGEEAELRREVEWDAEEAKRAGLRGKGSKSYLEKVWEKRLEFWKRGAEHGGCCQKFCV